MSLSALALAGLLGLLPAANNAAISSVRAEGPKRLEIVFEGIAPVPIIGRTKLAQATVTADIKDTTYLVRTHARAAGVLNWFIDYNLYITAAGLVKPDGLSSVRYDSHNRDGKKNRHVIVDWTPERVTTQVTPRFGDFGTPPATPEQKMEAMDPLSLILSLAIGAGATPENPCGGPLKSFDGKQRFDIVLTYGGQLDYKSKAYTGKAIRCDIQYIELAGFKAKSPEEKAADRADMLYSNIVLGELDGGRIRPPLQIEGKSKKRGKMTVRVTSLKYGPAPAPGAG